MRGKSAAVAAVAVVALGAAPTAAAVPSWPNDSGVYLGGLVRCPDGAKPNWVWFETDAGETGYADLSATAGGGAQYSRAFAIVPRDGVQVTASWSCGLFNDLFSTTFSLRRALWGRELTVNLCPESPCVP